MIGSTEITCNNRALWSPSPPQCQSKIFSYKIINLEFNVPPLGVYCPNLRYDTTRLSLSIKRSRQAKRCSSSKYCVGDIITFSALPGYYLQGRSYLACLQQKSTYQSRGNWNVSQPPQALGIMYVVKFLLVLKNYRRKHFGIIINTVIIIEDFLAYIDIWNALIIDLVTVTNKIVRYGSCSIVS